MKEMSMNLTIFVGFIVEIILFQLSGFMLSEGYPLSSMFYFICGLSMAWWVGTKIQKQAVEKYKREEWFDPQI